MGTPASSSDRRARDKSAQRDGIHWWTEGFDMGVVANVLCHLVQLAVMGVAGLSTSMSTSMSASMSKCITPLFGCLPIVGGLVVTFTRESARAQYVLSAQCLFASTKHRKTGANRCVQEFVFEKRRKSESGGPDKENG